MEPAPIPNAEPDDIRRALLGLVYPVPKDEVLRHARDHGGIDHEVEDVLGRIPDRTYASEQELLAALRAVYLLEGVPPGAIPI